MIDYLENCLFAGAAKDTTQKDTTQMVKLTWGFGWLKTVVNPRTSR